MSASKPRLRVFVESLYSLTMSFQLTVCFLCLALLYYTVFKSMVYDWLHLPDFSHGFLIPFVSLYFLWERWNKLRSLVVSPRNSGVAVLLLGILLLIFGNLGSESFTMRFSFLLAVSGIVLFLLGWSHLKILLFPIGFLIFMIPIPSILMHEITFPMQLFASSVAAFSLEQFAIPIFREGNIIVLADTRLEVAEACSGIRSLISLLALGTVFAYFTKRLFWQRVVLVASCFPIAILVNALRVTVTGVIAHYYGISAAEGFFHGLSGYLLFLLALVFLVGIGFLIGKLSRSP